MRAPFASILHEVLPDASPDCSVIDTVRAQLFAYRLRGWIQGADALHVARVSDVHRGGKRGNARARLPYGGTQKVRHRAIDVVSEDDAIDRESQGASPHGGECIAEISRGNDVGGARARAPLDIEAGCGVVHHLRQQPADVDAVGGTESMSAAQIRIDERFLHQALAVIEAAVDAQRTYIAAPAGQLLLLAGADQAARVENDDPDPGTPVKCGRNRAAGVARRSEERRV